MSLFPSPVDALALGTLLSSLLVITAKNPVVAVLFLIATFVSAAGYLMVTGVEFIGIAYIIVYVGAIAVLFLFVIMMIDVRLSDVVETGTFYTQSVPLGSLLALLFVYEGVNATPHPDALLSPLGGIIEGSRLWLLGGVNATPHPDALLVGVDVCLSSTLPIQSLGQLLYTQGAIGLIAVGLILLLSMVAPVFLSKK